MAVFQKKIIIGSVLGFVATAIGLVAVFFPSVFNLEKQSMATYKSELRTERDGKKLYEFLKSNENKIVQLEIHYTEEQPYKWVVGRNNVNMLDEKGYPARTLFFSTDWEFPDEGFSRADFGDNLRFGVDSHSLKEMGSSNFYRENGGFGIWIGKMNPKEDKEWREVNTKSYQIYIPYKSEANALYSWKSVESDLITKIVNSTGQIKMVLSGTFFVNPQKQQPDLYLMSYAFHKLNCWDMGVDFCDGPSVFKLEPLSPKDLQLRKY